MEVYSEFAWRPAEFSDISLLRHEVQRGHYGVGNLPRKSWQIWQQLLLNRTPKWQTGASRKWAWHGGEHGWTIYKPCSPPQVIIHRPTAVRNYGPNQVTGPDVNRTTIYLYHPIPLHFFLSALLVLDHVSKCYLGKIKLRHYLVSAGLKTMMVAPRFQSQFWCGSHMRINFDTAWPRPKEWLTNQRDEIIEKYRIVTCHVQICTATYSNKNHKWAIRNS